MIVHPNTPPGGGRIDVLNLALPHHAGFIFELLQANREWLLDDFHQDVIAMIEDMHQSLIRQCAVGWLPVIREEYAGLLWVEVDDAGVGKLYGASLPRYRHGIARHIIRATRRFVAYCFEELGLRKLVAECAIYNHNAERLLKSLGFVKEGLLMAETLCRGRPVHQVRLRLLHADWQHKHHESQNPKPEGDTHHGKTQQ